MIFVSPQDTSQVLEKKKKRNHEIKNMVLF